MTATSSMVERVAEAIWQDESMRASGAMRRVSWEEVGEYEKNKFIGFASAAIEAMREPSLLMLKAGYSALKALYPNTSESHVGQYRVFEAMIDAALEEAP